MPERTTAVHAGKAEASIYYYYLTNPGADHLDSIRFEELTCIYSSCIGLVTRTSVNVW